MDYIGRIDDLMDRNPSERVKKLVSMFLGPNKGGPLSKLKNCELLIRATDSVGKLRLLLQIYIVVSLSKVSLDSAPSVAGSDQWFRHTLQ